MADTQTSPQDALAERLFIEGLGSFHMVTVYLGVQLGLFEALSKAPAITADELAAAANIDPRYAAEWAQAECAAGLIVAAGGDPYTGKLSLAEGAFEVL